MGFDGSPDASRDSRRALAERWPLVVIVAGLLLSALWSGLVLYFVIGAALWLVR